MPTGTNDFACFWYMVLGAAAGAISVLLVQWVGL